jgi:uncharacterized protein YjbI with pentapeptide repeats
VRLRGPWNWTAIAALIAALAAAAGLLYTGRSIDYAGRSLDLARAQNQVAEQGQLTDRFTKAVDQLDRTGTDHLQARLGAIYALERLTLDSPRDHPTIIEILSAFVRSSAPRPAADAGKPGPCLDQPPAVDVQSALSVLARRNPDHDRGVYVDLSATCLRWTNLTNAAFVGAELSLADLGEANLDHANLTGANLTGAYLHLAYLGSANLRDAELGDANLGSTYLSDADLTGAFLSGADLRHAEIRNADLRNADLEQADLRGADLADVNFSGANLTGTVHDGSTTTAGAQTDDQTEGKWW